MTPRELDSPQPNVPQNVSRREFLRLTRIAAASTAALAAGALASKELGKSESPVLLFVIRSKVGEPNAFYRQVDGNKQKYTFERGISTFIHPSYLLGSIKSEKDTVLLQTLEGIEIMTLGRQPQDVKDVFMAQLDKNANVYALRLGNGITRINDRNAPDNEELIVSDKSIQWFNISPDGKNALVRVVNDNRLFLLNIKSGDKKELMKTAPVFGLQNILWINEQFIVHPRSEEIRIKNIHKSEGDKTIPLNGLEVSQVYADKKGRGVFLNILDSSSSGIHLPQNPGYVLYYDLESSQLKRLFEHQKIIGQTEQLIFTAEPTIAKRTNVRLYERTVDGLFRLAGESILPFPLYRLEHLSVLE